MRSLMGRDGWRGVAGWRLAVLLALLPLAAAAQEPARLDTSRVYELDAVVVTADRSSSRLASSTAAVSVLRAEAIRSLPVHSLADVLHQAPGFAFLHLDGLGYDPQATVRGFYGGGEAEYVVVLLDGRPLNGLETGRVNWNQAPLSAITSVEVIRGGASSLYGDAAIGGVINLVTDGGPASSSRWTVEGGSYGAFAGQAAVHGVWGGRAFSLYGDALRTDGFRDHAGRTAGSVGGSLALRDAPGRSLSLSTLHHGRRYDEPGPLTEAALAQSRTQAAPFYRFDNTDERTHRLALDAVETLESGAQLDGSLAAEHRRLDLVRTLPLGFGFADTKNRVLTSSRLLGSAQLTLFPLPLPHLRGQEAGQLVVGVDASHGLLDTRYYAVVSGDEEVYQSAVGARGDLDARGHGTRSAVAAFFQYDIRPSSRLRLSAGSRLDGIRDTFEPKTPGDGVRAATTHAAFSPRAGVNVGYAQSARHLGRVYVNAARSFKAPTLDQLYDQRTLPVPFPPFGITISNADLKPQHGTSVEAGLYHRAEVVPSAWAGELSLAVYQMDMTDELDFDLQQFRFVNIGKSRHRGVEAGLTLYGPGGATAFVNYTLQDVTLRFGDFKGNYVKAIPRDFVTGGLRGTHRSGLSAGLTARAARRLFLDDANTIRLPNYATVDARLAYRRGAVTLALDGFNLLDRAYSTTGFPDPGGGDDVFFYPAAGRTARLGVTLAAPR